MMLRLPPTIGVALDASQLTLRGPLGELHVDLRQHDRRGACFVRLETGEDGAQALTLGTSHPKPTMVLHALRALLRQYVTGLTQGFLCTLELVGVGYKVLHHGDRLEVKVGFSHPIEVRLPSDVHVLLPKPTLVCVFGVDPKRVAQLAADLQALKWPDAYKGKGFRRKDLPLRLKEGKKK